MYSRKVKGRVLDFEHARFLYQRSFVMYDRQTASLWIHTTGKAVIGDYKGTVLNFVPSTVTTWDSWRKEHPKTLVLDVREGRNAAFTLKRNPQNGGLSVGDPSGPLKFYPLLLLQKRRVINDTLDGENIVVVFDPKRWVYSALERGDRKFTWKDGALVDQTGKAWNMLTGVSGNIKLGRIPAVPWLRRAWVNFYPEGEVYGKMPNRR